MRGGSPAGGEARHREGASARGRRGEAALRVGDRAGSGSRWGVVASARRRGMGCAAAAGRHLRRAVGRQRAGRVGQASALAAAGWAVEAAAERRGQG